MEKTDSHSNTKKKHWKHQKTFFSEKKQDLLYILLLKKMKKNYFEKWPQITIKYIYYYIKGNRTNQSKPMVNINIRWPKFFFSELRIPFSSVYFEGKTLRNLDFYSIVKCSHNQPMYRSVIIFFLYVKSFSKFYYSTIWTSVCRTPKTLYKLLYFGGVFEDFWFWIQNWKKA